MKRKRWLKRRLTQRLLSIVRWIKRRRKSYGLNVLDKMIVRRKKTFRHRVNIYLKLNNIFCTFSRQSNNNILLSRSSGSYKIKTSKKNLKHTYKLVLINFFREVMEKRYRSLKRFIFFIVAPVRLRKKILKIIGNFFRKKNLLIIFRRLKCFNGCRPPKRVRKKRKRMRFFKH